MLAYDLRVQGIELIRTSWRRKDLKDGRFTTILNIQLETTTTILASCNYQGLSPFWVFYNPGDPETGSYYAVLFDDQLHALHAYNRLRKAKP